MLLLKRVETCSDSIMFGVTEGILENDIAEKIENVIGRMKKQLDDEAERILENEIAEKIENMSL